MSCCSVTLSVAARWLFKGTDEFKSKEMSLRAKIVGAVIRRVMKKRMANFTDADEVRSLASTPAMVVPGDVTVEAAQVAGVAAEWLDSAGGDPTRVILYLHGGGYVFGGLDSHREIGWRLAKETGRRVLLLDYRLAPEHHFPAPVEDAYAAYHWLLEQSHAAQQIVVAGDSAGGGLALALALKLKDEGVTLPEALVLLSPWADLTLSGATIDANDGTDVMLSRGAVQRFADIYLNGQDAAHPYASPVLGDLSGLPRTYVIVGSGEVLRSDSDRLVEGINSAAGQVDIEVWPDMMHVFPIMARLIPEGKKAIKNIAQFLDSEKTKAS